MDDTQTELTPVPGAEPRYDDDGREIVDVATCGVCGRSWNDAQISDVTPAPSGRCPFEYDHEPTIPQEVKDDLTRLVAALIEEENWEDFAPGGDCHDPDDGDEVTSAMQLTVGTNDGTSWGYQTGDNSFTGGAYGSRHWAVTWIGPDSKPADVVEEICDQWLELLCEAADD